MQSENESFEDTTGGHTLAEHIPKTAATNIDDEKERKIMEFPKFNKGNCKCQ